MAPELGCDVKAFRSKWKALRPDVVTGAIPFALALTNITATLGRPVDPATVQRLCDERRRVKAEPFTRIEPQVLTMLDGLRNLGVRLGVVSNCFAEDVTAWSRCPLAPRFDCTVFSFEVGLAKPDRRIFVEAARRLQVDTSDIWYIADGSDNELAGAAQAGLCPFKALWFLRRWPHFRNEACDHATIAAPDDVVALVARENEEAPDS